SHPHPLDTPSCPGSSHPADGPWTSEDERPAVLEESAALGEEDGSRTIRRGPGRKETGAPRRVRGSSGGSREGPGRMAPVRRPWPFAPHGAFPGRGRATPRRGVFHKPPLIQFRPEVEPMPTRDTSCAGLPP